MFHTRIEVIPTNEIVTKVVDNMPVSTAITVRSPPRRGIAKTMRTAVQLASLGYQVVPHLVGRDIKERSELAGILRGCAVAGITEVLAVGGDFLQSGGPYSSSLELMEDIREMSGGQVKVGIAGYPEGHPNVGTLHLLDSLLAKQHLASHIVTQMCFAAPKIKSYVQVLRREGVELPVWAGVAGEIPKTQLLSLASEIGVGPSLKLLSRNGPLGRRVLSAGVYSPQSLIADLAALPETVSGIHLHTFNNFDKQQFPKRQTTTSSVQVGTQNKESRA